MRFAVVNTHIFPGRFALYTRFADCSSVFIHTYEKLFNLFMKNHKKTLAFLFLCSIMSLVFN